MRRKINILSEDTIIKIAAGEIIENPASIIKELVENSIDAGSNKINIEIKNNGQDLIKVTDNGEGFNRDELKIAFKRHTTSKIKTIEDLDNALSLGFRGEALSSICNVSKVTVITKSKDDSIGTIAKIDYLGNIASMDDIVTNNGTTIICEDLFSNIPVRRIYLENKKFELNKTNEILNKLALSNLDVSIGYVKDEKLIFLTDYKNRKINNIYSVLGKNVSENLREIHYKDDTFEIKGFISNNQLYKSNRSYQYIFVNNRSITDLSIAKIIEKEYQSTIPINRFPVFLLYINTSSKQLDVNIHPKKDIVKFLEFEKLESILSTLINRELNNSFKIREIGEEKKETNNIFDSFKIETKTDDSNIEDNSIIFKDFSDDIKDENNDYIKDNVNKYKTYSESSRKLSVNNYIKNENKIVEDNTFFDDEKINIKIFKNGYRFIGNFLNQYLLLEDSKDLALYFLDQHAAHERINYERLLQDYENSDIPTQTLLNGFIVELNHQQFEKIIIMKDVLSNIGIIYEDFGDNSIIIREVPANLNIINPEKLIIDILDDEEIIKSNIFDINPNILMKKACSASIKSGERLSSIDVSRLINELNSCDMPFTCPHGRPTIVKISKNELDKKFFRIQNEK